MSLQEAKEVFGTLIFGSTIISLVILYVLYKIAEISYKKAHKSAKKVDSTKKKVQIVYNLGDTSKMTLPEIKALRASLEQGLKGAM